MLNTKYQYLIIFLLFPIFCQAQLVFSGEIRPRSEYRHGFKTLAGENQEAAFFIDQRTRLNFNFKTINTEYYLSLQDVRVWGDQSQLVTNNGISTGIHQAWAKLKLNQKSVLKLGRQVISYDDQRIFGGVGWAQQARSHDAAVFVFQDSSFTGHIGIAFNQDRPRLFTTLYTVPKNYKALQYVWLHKDWKALKGSFLFLNNGLQVIKANGDFETNYSQTVGGRLGWKEGKIGANIAAYYQSGTNGDTLDTKIKAFYLGADISYAASDNLNLITGIEILSGNDKPITNGENNAFNPFYGTNHKFNGLMDYFYVGNHTGNVGLNDYYVSLFYEKLKFNARLTAHFFATNGVMVEPQSRVEMSKNLGTEFDFSIGWKINKETGFQLGYSQLFGTDTMEALKGGNSGTTNNWMWAMVTIKPSFSLKGK